MTDDSATTHFGIFVALFRRPVRTRPCRCAATFDLIAWLDEFGYYEA